MKFSFFLAVFILFAFNKQDTTCFPDVGIKTAIVYTEKGSENKMTIEFDKLGRPFSVNKSLRSKESTADYSYEGVNLKWVINTENQSDFSFAREGQENSGTLHVDTIKVLNHDNQGRPLESKNSKGERFIFSYQKCNNEVYSCYSQDGVLTAKHETIKKDGVVTETIWTSFFPETSDRVSKYYNYVFNNNGHWIKRSYKHQGREEIVEYRTLEYY